MNNLIFSGTNFHQDLDGGRMKDRVGQLIQ